jgi:hypothetical protein
MPKCKFCGEEMQKAFVQIDRKTTVIGWICPNTKPVEAESSTIYYYCQKYFELLDKFENGTLGKEEMKELKLILEKELEKAKKNNKTSLVINFQTILVALEGKIKG